MNMKNKFLITVLTFFCLTQIYGQDLKTKYWSYVYSTPFYSWKKQGLISPKKLIRIEKDSVVKAIGFYLLGDENRYVGDLKVQVNDTIGWMSSIVFNTDDVRQVELLNKDYYERKVNSKIVQMKKNNGGTFTIDCKVNGLPLKFIFDTGASDVSISLTEALFMFKNGYLDEDDITGTQYYSIANGEITEGTTINIKKLEFGEFILYNVKASISHELLAPLLLGQSALSKLGKIVIDYQNATLEIIE